MRLPLVLLATLQPAAALIASCATRVAPLPAPLRRLVLRGGAAEGAESDDGTSRLYPALDAHETGSITVGIHEVAYSIYGNPQGAPALFVHGGPGGGTVPNHARYFDPEHYRIILVDQRGCGKSKPFASLEENTTWDLVADYEKIREKLGIERWLVFGGSWGSTLGLSYAVKHPERVTALVLRGIFLLRKKELDFFYEGSGTAFVFPEAWEKYAEVIPADEVERDGYVAAYGKRLRGELGEEEMRRAAKAWSVWEGSVSRLLPPTPEALEAQWAGDDFSLAFARIENHYFTNGGFFERGGWLLEDAQIDRIKDIPCVIVQGRYDVVCPATSAWELHRKLPGSTLHITTTGHSAFEPEIVERLVEATDGFRGVR